MLLQVVERLRECVEKHELSAIHEEDMTLNVAVSALLRDAKQNDLQVGLAMFGRQVADLHAAGDANDQPRSEAQLRVVLEAVQKLEASYPEDVRAAARAMASRYTCPMHAEVLGKKDEPCPKCGMPLDQLVRPALFRPGTTLIPTKTIRANTFTDTPLKVGEKKYVTVHLAKIVGDGPVRPIDLREVHTQKIHLLVVDASLTDYHHEHPQPTQTAGDYAFTFTPQKPGPYRVWADVRPLATGFQEYVMTDIPGVGKPEPLVEKGTKLHAELDGLRFDLAFAQDVVKAGQPVSATLRITDEKGAPFSQLEPIMAAYAHLVGFCDDFSTVLHLHPKGAPPQNPADRGGPELEFTFFALRAGFVRLFAQVQVGGISKLAPLGVNVLP
ncbi:MAG: hypothetical protein QOD99_2887 [Chthoniobacter sp.]|nr:hypothetical protein [Chthoniobacter sp.]